MTKKEICDSLIRYLQTKNYDDSLFIPSELDAVISSIREFANVEYPKSLKEPCGIMYDNPPDVPDINNNGELVYGYIRCPRCFHRYHQDYIDDPVCEYCGQVWKL